MSYDTGWRKLKPHEHRRECHHQDVTSLDNLICGETATCVRVIHLDDAVGNVVTSAWDGRCAQHAEGSSTISGGKWRLNYVNFTRYQLENMLENQRIELTEHRKGIDPRIYDDQVKRIGELVIEVDLLRAGMAAALHHARNSSPAQACGRIESTLSDLGV